MKKAIFLFLIIFTFVSPAPTTAHELIPQVLEEYVRTHPNATPAEIKQFADTQDPSYAQKFRDGEEILKIARDQNTSVFDNMLDFFKIGVKHILSGSDHILFVLSVLLVFVSWKEIVKLTSSFTVAHSITLVLAGTGILTLSSRIVEPFIALSIIYVAVTSVFLKGKSAVGGNRAKIGAVFFFGLFHGLGFAGLLKEIQIPSDKFVTSLLAFNLGIEGGQLIIVLCAFPLIYLFRKKPWYPLAIKIVAVIIATIALVWFLRRVFLV